MIITERCATFRYYHIECQNDEYRVYTLEVCGTKTGLLVQA